MLKSLQYMTKIALMISTIIDVYPAIISAIAKLFERIVYNQLYDCLKTNRISLIKYSVWVSFPLFYSPLLDATYDWFFNVNNGLLNSVVFLEFAKAFDTVDQLEQHSNVFIPISLIASKSAV